MGAIFAVALARARLTGGAAGPAHRAVGRRRRSRCGARSPRAGGAVTLLVGAERDGLPAEVVAACERHARIPIAGESLNAAMAATVALYEMTRDSSRVPAS